MASWKRQDRHTLCHRIWEVLRLSPSPRIAGGGHETRLAIPRAGPVSPSPGAWDRLLTHPCGDRSKKPFPRQPQGCPPASGPIRGCSRVAGGGHRAWPA